MRGVRLLTLAAAAAVLGTAACSAPRRDASRPAAAPAPQVHRLQPAPQNPDLAAVMERFYQQVEGEHWPFAYAMLSARYRATITQDELKDRYASLVAPDVTLQQAGDSTVVSHIVVQDAARGARTIRIDETVKLAWDGEQWTIDGITRRVRVRGRTR